MERFNHDESGGRTPWRQILGGVVASALVLGLIASLVAVTASTRRAAGSWGVPTWQGSPGGNPPTAFGMEGWGAAPAHAMHRWADDPELLRERATWATGWALRSIDASADQEQRIQRIIGRAVVELAEMRPVHAEHRDALMGILLGEEIDREELEAIRTEELRLLDEASRAMLLSVADVAEVLTPAQRSELARRAARHWGS